VSAGAGGGYDTLARTLARFLTRHLPGNPIILVRNMAGGGGLAAANALFSGAETDGTYIGLLQSQTPFDPLLGAREARFDATKFNWLGTPRVETGLFVLWNAVPIDTLAQAKERDITVGAAGANSTPAFHARLFNDVLGLKLKLKTGYPALTDAFYGLERGELEGYTSVIYSALQATKSDWLPQKKIKALLQYGPEKRDELAGVPSARDAAGNDDDRILLDAAFAPLALGRPLVMPPGVPATASPPCARRSWRRSRIQASSPRARGCLSGQASRTMARRCRRWSRAPTRHRQASWSGCADCTRRRADGSFATTDW
jgi:tripartite-type tricarboxylate transporter receptor subunit TctC